MKIANHPFIIISLLYTLGRTTVQAATGYNVQHQEEQDVLHDWDDEPIQPADRIPAVMDLGNPNPEAFVIEGSPNALEITPYYYYIVPEVIYNDETIWSSDDGWYCTQADIYKKGGTVFIILGFEKEKKTEYKAMLRPGDGEDWQDIPMFYASNFVSHMTAQS